MPATLRLFSIVFALAYLLIGWIWAYWIALIGAVFGAIGLGLRWAARRLDGKQGVQSTKGSRALDGIALWLNVAGFVVSALALVLTLLAN